MSSVNETTAVAVKRVDKAQPKGAVAPGDEQNAALNDVVNAKNLLEAAAKADKASDKATQEPRARLAPKALEAVVTHLNEFVQTVQRDISFNVDERTGGVVVKVKNADTDEVIRQIPSEEVLAIKDRLEKQGAEAIGLVLNAKV